MRGITVQRSEIAEVLNRPLSQELLARDLTRPGDCPYGEILPTVN